MGLMQSSTGKLEKGYGAFKKTVHPTILSTYREAQVTLELTMGNIELFFAGETV